MSRCGNLGLPALALWLALAGAAAAQEEPVLVLRVGEAPLRSGLVQTLRIQLSGMARVEASEAPLPAGHLDARIDAAVERAERRGALLALWVEGPPNGDHVAVFLVGHRPGRALLEVVQVPGGRAADVDRSVALKVRDVAESVLQARRQPTPVPSLLSKPAPVEAPAPTWSGLFELGATGATLSGAGAGQWGLLAALGAGLGNDRLQLALLGRVRLAPAVSFAGDGGELELSEIAPGLWVAAAMRRPGFQVGVGVGGSLRLLHAEGRTPQGTEGQRDEMAVSVSSAAELRLGLGPTFDLFLRLGAELTPHRQRFALNETALADTGHLRPFLELGVGGSL